MAGILWHYSGRVRDAATWLSACCRLLAGCAEHTDAVILSSPAVFAQKLWTCSQGGCRDLAYLS